MLNRKLIILCCAAFFIFGCQLFEKSDKSADNTTSVEQNIVANDSTEPAKDPVQEQVDDRIAQLTDENLRLIDIITEQETSINHMKAQLAAAQASMENMTLTLANTNKNKRNILFVTGISIFANLILIWLLIIAKRGPKRLALPEGRNMKQNKTDNTPTKPSSPTASSPKDDTDEEKQEPAKTVAKKNDVKKEPSAPKRRGRPAGSKNKPEPTA